MAVPYLFLVKRALSFTVVAVVLLSHMHRPPYPIRQFAEWPAVADETDGAKGEFSGGGDGALAKRIGRSAAGRVLDGRIRDRITSESKASSFLKYRSGGAQIRWA